MATSKPLAINSVPGVGRVLDYLCDRPKRPSHKDYTIETDSSIAPHAFVERLARGLREFNAEAAPSNQVRIPARWLIVRFPDETWLNKGAATRVKDVLVKGLCEDSFWAWHLNIRTGAADLNLVIPSVVGDNPPVLKRWLARSLWCEAKDLVDEVCRSLNVGRKFNGQPPICVIPDYQRERREQRGGSIEALLGRVSREKKIPLSIATLPQLLVFAGWNPTFWEIEDQYLLLRRGKKRLRLKLDALLVAAGKHWKELGIAAPAAGVDQSLHLRPAIGTKDPKISIGPNSPGSQWEDPGPSPQR
jgi:hypothetical protein